MDQYFRPAPAQKGGEFNLRCSDQSTGCLVGSCPTTLVWVVLVDHMTVILNMRESSAQNSMYTYLLWIFNLIMLQIICIIYIVAFVPGVIDLPLQFFFAASKRSLWIAGKESSFSSLQLRASLPTCHRAPDCRVSQQQPLYFPYITSTSPRGHSIR
jgi:hypothetical protein